MLLTVLTVLVCAGCQPESPTLTAPNREPVPVVVEVFRPVATTDFEETGRYFGRIQPRNQLTLGFPTGGRLEKLTPVRNRVGRGDVLAELDVAPLEEQRKQQQAELDRLTSQQAPRIEVERLRRQLATLDEQIVQQRIVAPFECIVETHFVQVGSVIGPQQPVLSIFEVSNPQVHIAIPRRLASFMEDSQEFVFQLDDRAINVKLATQSLVEDPPGTVRMKFDVVSEMAEQKFVFGQTVEARFRFITSAETPGYWLPMAALSRHSNGLWTVFFVEDTEGQAMVRQRFVNVVQIRDQSVRVSDNLGESWVVSDGTHRLVSGQQVQVKKLPDADQPPRSEDSQ